MANGLNQDLRGKIVIIKKSEMEAEYSELKWRRFRVEGGFGSRVDTEGDTLLGRFLEDGNADRMKSHMVERLAADEETRQWETDGSIHPSAIPGGDLLDLVQQEIDDDRKGS